MYRKNDMLWYAKPEY